MTLNEYLKLPYRFQEVLGNVVFLFEKQRLSVGTNREHAQDGKIRGVSAQLYDFRTDTAYNPIKRGIDTNLCFDEFAEKFEVYTLAVYNAIRSNNRSELLGYVGFTPQMLGFFKTI